ncbi:UDP-glycosyltransferase UGT5-like [Colias croceus]|uniref:UDP-glycosyltransferase UGT5-like n=1 Tax=Colias crocea TaxID=72248 RepID=UPI001E28189C|nr:UDP-glycosyltransferase UGT5-like [Colias croceus]
MYRLILVLISASIIPEIYTARILAIFPTPSISHQVVFRPLTQELVKRGHHVTILTTDPVFTNKNRPKNLTEIDVHDLSYAIWREKFTFKQEFGKKETVYSQIQTILDLIVPLTEVQYKSKEVQELINDKSVKFDLLLIEAWTRQALIYSHIYKAPVIQVSSFGAIFDHDETVGSPVHPFLYPILCQQKIYNLTFWEKVEELYKYWWFKSLWFSREDEEIKLLRKFVGNDLPNYRELRNNIDMVFLNTHPMLLDNQPFPPNVISIWGIHKKPEKALPQELKSYLDSSKNGVVYISFGTNAPSSTLPSEFIQLLIRVFSKLPYDVLWKWEKDELPGKSENIRISKWLPQSDLLKHPKIKLFITQGGLQSTDEAITAGVPVIGIPMLGDQWYNVEKYVYHKIGQRLDMESINEQNLKAAIDTVIGDKSYRENMIKLRTLLKDQPVSALDRAVWWTEYVLRHGGAKHLRAAAANMPWTQYYEIEFVLKLLSLLAAIVVPVIAVIYFIIMKFMSKSKLKVS